MAPHKNDEAVFAGPGATEAHRGSVLLSTRLPLFGAKRGPGCGGRWLLVGPLSWICSDHADLVVDEPSVRQPRPEASDGLPYRYYFVGPEGASGYTDLSRVEGDAPDGDLEPHFAVAVVEERVFRDERWLRTRSGYWIASHELFAAHPSTFQGEHLAAPALPVSAPPPPPPPAPGASPPPPGAPPGVGVAWVRTDRTSAYAEPRAGKPIDTHVRLDRLPWREERAGVGGPWARVSEDGAPARWMRVKDLFHPSPATVPAEVTGEHERWIDVELASETLVAYEGPVPVFATVVSTGQGPPGSDLATPPGVHRIWVKLLSTNMDNLEKDEDERHFSIEDVPYVQFFDKAVALHGAFWHNDFGRPVSHGCVNLAPRDARWLFAFTSPHVPAGWSAVMPVRFEKGTVIRVR